MQVSIQTTTKLGGRISKPRSAELFMAPICDPTIIHTLIIEDAGKQTIVNITSSQCRMLASILANRGRERKEGIKPMSNITEMTPISLSFRGPHQDSRYKVANDAALKAGWENARMNRRTRWNLNDFDAAEKEFHRVMDNFKLSEERGA